MAGLSCRELEELALFLDGLSHPLRLAMVALLRERGPLYLSEIASSLGVSRALAKVHLKKLERSGIVTSRVELVEGRAAARRVYELTWQGMLCLSPELVASTASRCRGEGSSGNREGGG